MYSLFMLGKQRHIVAYLDGLWAKVKAQRPLFGWMLIAVIPYNVLSEN